MTPFEELNAALSRPSGPTRTPLGVSVPEPFRVDPQERKNFLAYRGARTEAMRGTRQIQAQGAGEELQAEFEGTGGTWLRGLWNTTTKGLSTLTQPVFDLLSISQYAGAGAALELQQSGNGYKAFERAAAEFANALPFVDEEDVVGWGLTRPTRPSWSQVLKKSGIDLFSEEKSGPWAAAVGGFVLDVALDPLVWISPTSIAKKLPFLGKGATALTTKFGETAVGKTLGEKFVKDFDIRQLARMGKVSTESAEKFIQNRRLMETGIDIGEAALRDKVVSMAAGMTTSERRLLGLYLDQPKKIQSVINQIGQTEQERKILFGRVQRAKKILDDVFDEDVGAGLMSPLVHRANYAFGTKPVTGESANAMEQVFDRMKIPPSKRGGFENILPFGPGGQLAQGVFGPSRAKTFDTIEERVLAAVPAELDIALMTAKRGFISVRQQASKRFVDAVLSDPTIARKLAEVDLATGEMKAIGKTMEEAIATFGPTHGPELFKRAKAFTDMLEKEGYTIYRPFRSMLGEGTEIGALRKGQKFKFGDDTYKVSQKVREGGVKATGEKGTVELARDVVVTPWIAEPAYVIPKPFADELNIADKIFRGESEALKFFGTMKKVQNLWKGYAVLSPGFHLRNMYSNWFNNYLGGVLDPRHYTDALKIQQGIEGVVVRLKDGRILKDAELLSKAQELGVHGVGMFGKDIPLSVERELLNSLTAKGAGKEIGARITGDELAKAVAETSPGRSLKDTALRLFGQEGGVLKANRTVGRAIENNARMAHWIAKLRKGYTPEDAAASVRKYLFDYNELTPFEIDVMKSVLPFYTWSRKNIPLQLQSLFSQPGKFSVVPKLMNEIEDLSENWKDIPAPDYFQELHAVRLPRPISVLTAAANRALQPVTTATGGAEIPEGIQPVFLNPNLPFQDINRMNPKDILSGMTPLAKIIFEQVPERGYSIFLDRPMERFKEEPGVLQEAFGVPLDKRAEMILEYAPVLGPTFGKGKRLVERAKRGQLFEQLMTEVLGIKLIPVDVDRVVKQKTFDRRRIVREMKDRLEAQGKTSLKVGQR